MKILIEHAAWTIVSVTWLHVVIEELRRFFGKFLEQEACHDSVVSNSREDLHVQVFHRSELKERERNVKSKKDNEWMEQGRF